MPNSMVKHLIRADILFIARITPRPEILRSSQNISVFKRGARFGHPLHVHACVTRAKT